MSNLLTRGAKCFNAALRPVLASRLFSGRMTEITYTGRRSGRTFSTPVAYARDGDEVTIRVMAPDAKQWWRNFTGDGGPISLKLADTDREGHAVAERDDRGRVRVTVRLKS
ncbi:hypothetical protein [Amycolatopsis minnesotensis]|uniref:DUF385 domain-containing protein n=1 Tax=Amycolatopsis minnesotensis TaxID=337894 RepID=A0ABN2S3S2_9PSEU